MGSTTYQIGRSWVRLARWCGYLLALFAVAYLGGYLFAPEEISLSLAIFGVAFFGGLAVLSLRLGHSPEVYSVEISQDGVRRTSSGAWIPWAGIVRLRERPILNRIDLIGPGGPTGITLEYQLEGFQEALDQVLHRVRIDLPHSPFRFCRPLLSWSRLFVFGTALGFSGVGGWVWLHDGGLVGLVLILMMLGALVHDSISQISEVTISDDSLTLRRGFRTTRDVVSNITAANLALRPIGNGNHYLDVFIEVDGHRTPIRPAGSDAFQLYAVLQSAMTRAAG